MIKDTHSYLKHTLSSYVSIDNVYTVFFSNMVNGFSSAGESHDFHELVYIDHGEIQTEVYSENAPSEIISLPKGTAYLHAPNQFHRHFVQTNARGSLCIITFESENPLLSQLAGRKLALNRTQKEYLSAAMNAASRLFKSVQNNQDSFVFFRSETCNKLVEQIFKNNLELLFLELLCDSVPDTIGRGFLKNGIPENIVEDVQNHLKRNVHNKVRIEDICREFSYSKTTLSNKFKSVTGVSIIHYFNQLKVEEAMNLIENSDATITNIAASLNFSSCQYFSKVFMQITGIYPRDFKHSIARKTNAKYLRQLTMHNEKSGMYLHVMNEIE